MNAKVILSGFSGSMVHGVQAVQLHDVDFFRVEVFPKEFYLGLDSFAYTGIAQSIMPAGGGVGVPMDTTIYDVRHFFKLALTGNPSVLSLLWTPDEYLNTCAAGKLIYAKRDLFSSQMAYQTFRGMAINSWGKWNSDNSQWKQAAHALRLLRMGTEFLATGTLVVDRRDMDAAELLAVRQGMVSAEDYQELFDLECAALNEAMAETNLPERPNRALVNGVLVDVMELAWRTNGV